MELLFLLDSSILNMFKVHLNYDQKKWELIFFDHSNLFQLSNHFDIVWWKISHKAVLLYVSVIHLAPKLSI